MGMSCKGRGEEELRLLLRGGGLPSSPALSMAEMLGIVVPEALVCGKLFGAGGAPACACWSLATGGGAWCESERFPSPFS